MASRLWPCYRSEWNSGEESDSIRSSYNFINLNVNLAVFWWHGLDICGSSPRRKGWCRCSTSSPQWCADCSSCLSSIPPCSLNDFFWDVDYRLRYLGVVGFDLGSGSLLRFSAAFHQPSIFHVFGLEPPWTKFVFFVLLVSFLRKVIVPCASLLIGVSFSNRAPWLESIPSSDGRFDTVWPG